MSSRYRSQEFRPYIWEHYSWEASCKPTWVLPGMPRDMYYHVLEIENSLGWVQHRRWSNFARPRTAWVIEENHRDSFRMSEHRLSFKTCDLCTKHFWVRTAWDSITWNKSLLVCFLHTVERFVIHPRELRVTCLAKKDENSSSICIAKQKALIKTWSISCITSNLMTWRKKQGRNPGYFLYSTCLYPIYKVSMKNF